ncbi:MAG: ADP-ribosylglycohydrolase family protein [Armatimonadetes bacterium]|nr:ADP-ribosylglycohydrolase family protein [Armatimonadota bacterium]
MPQSAVPLDHAYAERVYAGVLGKIIGVYLGRPFEQWSHTAIQDRLGEIRGYVHDRLGQPLIVVDDDITGTFTFVRAVVDSGKGLDVQSQDIGETWLDYTVEGKSIFWWGGFGRSTEHTAYMRLKAGYPAPESGSIALNGKVVAEQIGAQIFIDAWPMLCPGDPALAADLARRAASVSHDGVAVDAACLIAAMEAQAFVESDIDKLLDTGLQFIPKDGTIARLVRNIRYWRSVDKNWRATLARIHEKYSYAQWPGDCHVVPNHAVVLMALLWGDGDFSESMLVVNTAGYDTDCNSGNVGCLLGLLGGLAAFEGGYDWRGPVADRMVVSTADGGSAYTDAATTAQQIVETARWSRGLPPLWPIGTPKFSFPFTGCAQGFMPTHDGNVERQLYPEPNSHKGGYETLATSMLYPGQAVTAQLEGEGTARLYVRTSAGRHYGLRSEGAATMVVPDTGGRPVLAVGLEGGKLASMDWGGTPETWFRAPGPGIDSGWLSTLDQFHESDPYQLVQDEGEGLAVQGTSEWSDLAWEATLTPALGSCWGLIVAYKGLRRWVGLLADGSSIRLVRRHYGEEKVLSEMPLEWLCNEPKKLRIETKAHVLVGIVDGKDLPRAELAPHELRGAVGILLRQSRVWASEAQVSPQS